MIIIENSILFLTLIIWLFYSIFILITGNKFYKFFKYLSVLPVTIHFSWVVIRVIQVSHAPFSNMYESLIFFSLIYSIKIMFSKIDNKKLMPLFILPSLILIVIGILLPYSFKEPNPLVPVLKSFWIYIHVPSFFIGYVSLTFAFIYAIILIFNINVYKAMKIELKLSYFFITIGIVTGSFWAELSWANFWGWDPKETWALIVWLLLTCLFHIKNRRLISIFVILSFLALLFTYFGVMFLIPGLHSYS